METDVAGSGASKTIMHNLPVQYSHRQGAYKSRSKTLHLFCRRGLISLGAGVPPTWTSALLSMGVRMVSGHRLGCGCLEGRMMLGRRGKNAMAAQSNGH